MVSIKGYNNTGIKLSNRFSSLAISSIPAIEEESESTKARSRSKEKNRFFLVKRPNWLDLPSDLTANIFKRLSILEILSDVCLVCTQWLKICKNPLMWRTIYMPKYVDANPWEMQKICCNAVKLSCGHLESIIIDDYYGTSDLLKLIADNGSHLRCMKVMNYNIVTDEEFSEVVRKLPQLEKVFVPVYHTAEATLEALGRSCPLLKWLQYNSYSLDSCASDKMAFLIAETMPGLRHLDMNGHKLTELGVLAIIDKCPLLEYLDISFCLNLNEDLEKRCIDQIKDLWMPYFHKKRCIDQKRW